MLRTIKIELNAAYPSMPLEPVQVFKGSSASFTILNVPRAVGKREITSLSVQVKNAGSVTLSCAAVRVGSAWECTIPETHFTATGTITRGVTIFAGGKDENAATRSWTLGAADLQVLDGSGSVTPGETKTDVHREDFEDIDAATAADGLGQVKATMNKILTALKTGSVATLALIAIKSYAALTATNTLNDVSGTNTIGEIVAAGGGGGGSLPTNYLQPATNYTDAATNALPAWTKTATKPTYTASEVGAISTSGQNVLQSGWSLYAPEGYGLIDKSGDDWLFNGVVSSATKADTADELEFSLYGYDCSLRLSRSEPHWQMTDERGTGIIAMQSEIPDTSSLATTTSVNTVSNIVATWEDYWSGDKVRLSVTNYYGNTSGEPPRLRIEEFDHSVTNGTVISNVYRIVWDELTRQTNYQHSLDVTVAGISNGVMTAAFMQTATQLAGKAPRAWGEVTSAGADAPPGMVWHTEPNTVFAGGTEYAHVSVGEGTICVLTDNGAPVYTEGEEGKFRFKDDSGNYYFGFDIRESYTIGCRTDGIAVANQLVTLTYDLTAADNPTILHATNLTNAVWEEATVTWEQNPPAGTKVCYINVGMAPSGYYKAQMTYAGGAKFVTNMAAEFYGGIMATNTSGQTSATQLPVYPEITTTGVVWRVMWGD